MIRYLLVLALTTFIFINSNAQITNTGSQPASGAPKAMMLDENTVVKDSAGTELSYKDWHPLLLSGNYGIKSYQRGTDKPVHTLIKLSAEEKLKRAEFFANAKTAQVSEKIDIQNSTPAYTANYRLPQQSTSFHNGLKMEPFKARDINGKKIDIKALQGKIVVINFWFINCPACRDEMPELDELAKGYAADSNVVFIAISLDPKWKVKEFLKTTAFAYQQISDGRSYGNDYQVDLYPTNIVLDRKGIIKFNSVGSDHTGYWLKKTIEDVKAEN